MQKTHECEMMIWSFRENVFSHPFYLLTFYPMNTLNTGENFHYVPKEGDSAEIIANAIKVQKECLENNISSIKALV